MDELAEKYRKLNPFVENAVGENVIWGSDRNDFCDVRSINEAPFKALLDDIESVRADRKTRARFLVGPAGSGKSHLFARLRRRLANGQFTFASNPPTSVPHVKRFVLRKVVSGMTRPVMGPEGPLPYSQLQRMVYSLSQRILKPKRLNTMTLHRFWKQVPRAELDRRLPQFEQALADIQELEIPIHWRRVLFRILDDERRDLAAAWLSGNQSLAEADYQCLGVHGPLADDEISELMKQLGHLSMGAGPIVLILDQLDTLVRPEQIHEIESLMIDLNDSSKNWYAIVSLVEEKFDFWYSTLSIPFKERFGTVTADSVILQTAELSALSPEQRGRLIKARLGTPGLRAQRKRDGIDDPYYPLSEAVVQQLTSSDISNARMLIQKAEQAYVSSITGETQPAARKLPDFVDQLLADVRAELREEDLAVDTASIADRIGELLGLLWIVKSGSALQRSDGPLHTEVANFQGVDRVYACNEMQVRVVCYDVQQTSKFPSVLKKIVNAPPSTILVRDGRVSISGKATKERLERFQQDKKFFHLSLDQIKSLHALGKLLAKMREGEFENEATEPKPTERSMCECLAQHPDLAETDLAQAFLAMVGFGERTQEREPPRIGESCSEEPNEFPKNDSVVTGIARLMEAERWMSFERLCVRVSARGITADPRHVYQCLKERPICDSVMIYPSTVNLLDGIGIVIWQTEE